QYTQPATNVIGDVHTCIRYHGSVLQYAIVEYGHIGSTASYINDGHACFHVFFRHYSSSRGQRLQYEVAGGKPGFVHTALDIAYRVFIACDDMEVGADLHTVHPYRLGDIGRTVYGKLLRHNIYYLVACGNVSLILVSYQHIYIGLADDIVQI